MCGIFGMIGDKAVSTTKQALKYLEYRGYDSAGIAANDGGIHIFKCSGRVENLRALMPERLEANIAIGHTRWATHGAVCHENSHPFVSQNGTFAIVHNGIVENYAALKDKLICGGVTFSSQTDSEVIAHLLESNYGGDVLQTVLTTAKELEGSFAVVITTSHNGNLYAIKNKSPLVIGVSDDGKTYLCSDIRCISHWAVKVAVVPDNSVVIANGRDVKLYDFDGKEQKIKYFGVKQAERLEEIDGDFMLKEIMEIPDKIRQAKRNYFESGGLKLGAKFVCNLSRVYLLGCGTAYNSGLQTAAIARQFLDLDIIPVIASEFIYDKYPVDEKTLAVCISQSGETADTIRAAEKVTALGGYAYAVTNTDMSSLSFVCKQSLNIAAGAEYAVASTKAYNCQLVTMILMFAELAKIRGSVDSEFCEKISQAIDFLPQAADEILSKSYEISRLAGEIKNCGAVFFLGRTTDYPTACEASLKLKEISYIHSEAYPSGELKHGTLALMEENVAVVVLSTDIDLVSKTSASVSEVVTRGAKVICVSPYRFENVSVVNLPVVNSLLYGVISVIPLQLLSYYTAKHLGRDVDKPRHLAKSVTVE